MNEFSDLDKEDCHKDVHLITQEGKILRGEEVAKYLIEHFPVVSKFAWLLDSEVGQKALKKMYDIAGKYRKHYAGKHCSNC